MMFVSRFSIFTVATFIALTLGDLVHQYQPQYYVAYVAVVVGLLGAYALKLYEGA